MAMKRSITFVVVAVVFAGLLVVRATSRGKDAGLALEAHAQSLKAHDSEECTNAR